MDLKTRWRPGRIPQRFATCRVILRIIGLLLLGFILHQIIGSTKHPRKFPPSRMFDKYRSDKTEPQPVCLGEQHARNGTEKATLVMLVRNREIEDALSAIRQVEDRFNRRYHYPWTFLNDEPFTDQFTKYTSAMASGRADYAIIPRENWEVPEHINKSDMGDRIANMEGMGVIYGGSLSYRHMCRFNSGFFYRQEIMKQYDWYWRVEPGIQLYCDINYDPFTFMRTNNKLYGFVVTMYEFYITIPTLWDRTQEFITLHPNFVAPNNSLDFLVDDRAVNTYNLCHFWSNFEIASLQFYRSEAYSKYFEFLDKAGGFFYERWGDAPVHSLAISLFAPMSSIHHFADFGYFHNPCTRCPQDEESHASGRCLCSRDDNFDSDEYSCLPRWWNIAGLNKGAKRNR